MPRAAPILSCDIRVESSPALKAGAIVLVWSVGATIVIAKLVSYAFGGLRVSEEMETQGLDVTEHGEEGYIIE